MYVNNHTDVWGSWYDPSTGTWGYACCHSTIHVSYCSGKEGIEAAKASSAQNLLASTSASAHAEPPRSLAETASARDVSERVEQNYSKKRVGEGDVRLDDERLSRALQEEKKRKARGEEDDDDRSGKKRKNAGGSHDVTEEEMGKLPFFHMGSFIANDFDRGVPDESAHDGRSNGKLRGRGAVGLASQHCIHSLAFTCVSLMFELMRENKI